MVGGEKYVLLFKSNQFLITHNTCLEMKLDAFYLQIVFFSTATKLFHCDLKLSF